MNATPQTPDPTPSSYAEAGVDEEREQVAFARVMRPWLARTKVRSSMVTSITGLASGYFATIMHLPPGPAIALTTDGVGTKIMLAEEAGRWEPIGVDCVANNVNDLICVGAVPLALLDYIATDRIDEGVLDEVARGLFLGAELAGIDSRRRDRPDRRDARQVGERRAHAGPGRHRDRRRAAGAHPAGRQQRAARRRG